MKVRKLSLIIFIIVISIHANAAKEITGTHMFGFAASSSDSTIYITETQYVDSVYIGKSNFLFSRENYPYQLQNYLRSIGAVTPIYTTILVKDQKKIEKKYLSMRKKHEKSGKCTIKYIIATSSRYRSIIPQTSDLEQERAAEREAKEVEKVAKIVKKQAKRKRKLAEKGIIEMGQPVTVKDTKQ